VTKGPKVLLVLKARKVLQVPMGFQAKRVLEAIKVQKVTRVVMESQEHLVQKVVVVKKEPQVLLVNKGLVDGMELLAPKVIEVIRAQLVERDL